MQRINEKPQIVNDYEAGRAIPNQQIINKLERVVGELLWMYTILHISLINIAHLL